MTPENIDSTQVAYIVRQRLLNGTLVLDSTDAWDNAFIDEIVEATWHDIQVVVVRCQNKGRVVKGGSWADPPLYLMPGTRQGFPEDKTSSFIGFRVAMTRVGKPPMVTDWNNLQGELLGGPKYKKPSKKDKKSSSWN